MAEQKKEPMIIFCHQHSYMFRIPVLERETDAQGKDIPSGKMLEVYHRDGNGQFELNAFGRRVKAKKNIPFKEFTRLDTKGKPVDVTDWWCNLVVSVDDPDYESIMKEFTRLHKMPGQQLFTEEQYRNHVNPEAVAAEKRATQIADAKIKALQDENANKDSELAKYKKMYEDQKNRR
jgi:hypothetical protein